MRYRALALDLDGTLTTSDKRITQANKEAIWKAIDKDVAIILASGRPVIGITHIEKELELDRRGGYILAYNGGRIIDCVSGAIMYEKQMPKECVSDICRLSRKYGVYACTYNQTDIVAESDTDEYVLKEAICNNAKILRVDDLESYVDYVVNKFLIVGKHDILLNVQKELLSMHKDVIDAFFSEEYFLEVVPAGVAKSASLDSLLKSLNIESSELIACGDGMNDISMIKYAGLGIAMDNAYDEVKGYADYIAKSNDEDGVAGVIEKFIL